MTEQQLLTQATMLADDDVNCGAISPYDFDKQLYYYYEWLKVYG